VGVVGTPSHEVLDVVTGAESVASAAQDHDSAVSVVADLSDGMIQLVGGISIIGVWRLRAAT
jgi:hypothetical protein